MSAFNNGGGSLKSSNKAAALMEVALYLGDAERQASTIDNPINNITIGFDTDARTATITATLPIGSTLNPSGQVVISASDYLGGGFAFNGGAGGDLKATHPAAAFLEMAQIVSASEQSITVNTPNNVTIALDLEGNSAAVAATLPITVSVDGNGRALITATDYLP